MKSIFFILCVFPLFLFGQSSEFSLPEREGQIVFEQSFSIDQDRADSLYLIARRLVIDKFRVDTERMFADDMLKNFITGDGYFTISKSERVSFIFIISLRDCLFECKIFGVEYPGKDNKTTRNDLEYFYANYKSGGKAGEAAPMSTMMETKKEIEDLMRALKKAITGP